MGGSLPDRYRDGGDHSGMTTKREVLVAGGSTG